METGYRRRILIEPSPGVVTAELEDDYHRMVVTLRHEDGLVTGVSSEMKRWPWTTCRGAIAQLEETFSGQPLAGLVKRGERFTNCTHLHDLALFAAAHALGDGPVAYDVIVTDAVDGVHEARVSRGGRPVFAWTMRGPAILAPAPLAGRTIAELGDWIAGLDRGDAEAARILRWATILAQGRAMDIPAGMPATAFPLGTCFTFQPDRAHNSTRRPGADVDFSRPGMVPMADRADAFP